MKKIILLALLFPLFAIAQGTPDVVLTSDRVWVKDGHMAAFKKALAAHVKEYHSGQWKWRVYEVLSGPDTGAFQINEGPNGWTALEGRGDLSAAHTKHYETQILPHISKSAPTLFVTFDDKLSTTQAGNWSNKAVLTRFYIKPGRSIANTAALKTNKAVWEKLGRNVAVWRTWASGQPQVILASRLKEGFKDFDNDMRAYAPAYDEVNGAGSYDKFLEDVARNVDSIVGEMIEYKAELSSMK
ncbi:hypothetical protein [Pseudoduganella sp. OTU4001]|uniref:hypothetical protein n=1 Tax=Pseudoduganella sp. OTU4001 TaxID=3043854 RepID=UPI00313D0018